LSRRCSAPDRGAALPGGLPQALGSGPLREEVDHAVSNLIPSSAGPGLAPFFGRVLPAGGAREFARMRGAAGVLLPCAMRCLAPVFILGLMPLFRPA